jgi:hypothetical protein
MGGPSGLAGAVLAREGFRVTAAGAADGRPARGAAGAVNSSALRFADRTKRGSVSIAPDSEIARRQLVNPSSPSSVTDTALSAWINGNMACSIVSNDTLPQAHLNVQLNASQLVRNVDGTYGLGTFQFDITRPIEKEVKVLYSVTDNQTGAITTREAFIAPNAPSSAQINTDPKSCACGSCRHASSPLRLVLRHTIGQRPSCSLPSGATPEWVIGSSLANPGVLAASQPIQSDSNTTRPIMRVRNHSQAAPLRRLLHSL